MDTSNSGGDSWAKFDDVSAKETTTSAPEENWADFSSFDDIANSPATTTKPDNEPVAMDTADATQSRMAQYSMQRRFHELLLCIFISIM